MNLIDCPYCGEKVANVDYGTCPKCGGDYSGWEIRKAKEEAAEARRQARLTPEQRKKEEKDTYLGCLGGCAIFIVIAGLIYGAIKLLENIM